MRPQQLQSKVITQTEAVLRKSSIANVFLYVAELGLVSSAAHLGAMSPGRNGVRCVGVFPVLAGGVFGSTFVVLFCQVAQPQKLASITITIKCFVIFYNILR